MTFKTKEFVWVERFYKHLVKCFDEMQLKGCYKYWQHYDYGVNTFVTYSLIFTRNHPISFKYFRGKKNFYFCEIEAKKEEN